MRDQKAKSSILDFPTKKLPSTIWRYSKEGELPTLKSEFRDQVMKKSKELTDANGLPFPYAIDLYGGAASYQWAPGSDIDLALYVKWPDGTTLEETESKQKEFKDVEMPWEGSPVHFFLKSPDEKDPIEVADSFYEILTNKWVLPPLVLPENFDPDTFFKPFLEASEKVAQELDLQIGSLMRDVNYLKKLKKVDETTLREPEIYQSKIEQLRKNILEQAHNLVERYDVLRKKRDFLYQSLRKDIKHSGQVSRMARFQEPEIVWKYLDRSGYLELLHGLKKSLETLLG